MGETGIINGSLPWKAVREKKTRKRIYKEDSHLYDSDRRIEHCLNCPYAECVDCYSKPREKKRGRPTRYEECSDYIERLLDSGWTTVAICNELSISRNTLWNYRRKIAKEKIYGREK